MLTGGGFCLIAIIELLLLFFQFWYSDKIAMFGMGATEVTALEAPQLHAMIDKLCHLAEMPKPRIAIADTDVPNAFASGRNSNAAVIIVTRGLQNTVTDEELFAVLSHETAHIAHRDVAVMSLASSVLVIAGLFTQASFWNSVTRRNKKSSNSGSSVFFAVFVYVVGLLLIKALSRCRELSADRTGAVLIHDPKSLASALTKICGAIEATPQHELRTAETFSALLFSPALGRQSKGKSYAHLLSTHPTLEERLQQLREIEVELSNAVTV